MRCVSSLVGNYNGEVYVFDSTSDSTSSNTWTNIQVLTSADVTTFGYSVASVGSLLAVGSKQGDSVTLYGAEQDSTTSQYSFSPFLEALTGPAQSNFGFSVALAEYSSTSSIQTYVLAVGANIGGGACDSPSRLFPSL